MKNNSQLKNIAYRTLLAIILLVFLFGIARLLIMRFETGDVYPPYSSLRTDPLGTSAFYESINNLHGISANRNYQSESKLNDGRSATVFYFGIYADALRHANAEDVKALESLASRGSRIVILFYPENTKRTGDRKLLEEKKNAGNEKEKKHINSDKNRYGRNMRFVSLPERWGFEFVNFESHGESLFVDKGIFASDAIATVRPVSWHSAVYFESLNAKWNKICIVNEHPVIIERNLGKGTIVLATDAYFVSNEALRMERHSELLAWLVGNNTSIIFDETHLGIREDPGIAALTRRYRLHGLLAGFILLAVLFIWKNSFSLVPPCGDEISGNENLYYGKDYISGFISLLRRNVADRDILAVCFKEWRNTLRYESKGLGDKFKEIQSIIESENKVLPKEKNPVKAYQHICKILSERKTQ